MTDQNMLIAADGHLHWYPFYEPGTAFHALLANLDKLTADRHQDGLPVLRIGCMMERAGSSFLDQISAGRFDSAVVGLEIAPGADGAGVFFMREDQPWCWMAPCQQAATAERLEVLGMAMTDPLPDGLTLRDSIRRVCECGGVPVIPWGAGKWLFGRGRLLMELLKSADPDRLLLGDTSLRPQFSPVPAAMKSAHRAGFTILPGSDPLPLPGEERLMGSYGFTYEGPFDISQPMASLRTMLTSGRAAIRQAGARNGSILAAVRMVRMNIFKRFRDAGPSQERAR